MTTKHTPGPWVLHKMTRGGAYITGSDDPRQAFAAGVCEVYDDDDRQGAGTMDANAALIAAAPDLLTLARHAARQDLAPDVLRKRALALLAALEPTP